MNEDDSFPTDFQEIPKGFFMAVMFGMFGTLEIGSDSFENSILRENWD